MPNPLFYYEDGMYDFFNMIQSDINGLYQYIERRVPQMRQDIFDFFFDLYKRMMKEIIYRRNVESIIIDTGPNDITNPINFYEWACWYIPYLNIMKYNFSLSPIEFSVDPYLKSIERSGSIYSRINCCIIPTDISRNIKPWDATESIISINGTLVCVSPIYGKQKIIKRSSAPQNLKGFKRCILRLNGFRMWSIENTIKKYRMEPTSFYIPTIIQLDILSHLEILKLNPINYKDFNYIPDTLTILSLDRNPSDFNIFKYLSE